MVNFVGGEYGKAVAAYLTNDDEESYAWVRTRTDTFPMCIVEEKFASKQI